MTIDFEITESGDLILDEEEKSELSVSFFYTSMSTLTVDLTILKSPLDDKYEDGELIINFKYSYGESDIEHNASVIDGDDEKVQRIRIALTSELNSIKNSLDVGSLLEKSKHKDIHSEEVHAEIESTILNVITGILKDPAVRVVPSTSTGSLYFHNIDALIYEEGNIFMKFTV